MTNETQPALIYQGHASWVNTANFSLDGKFIASASKDETIHIWEASTGKRVATCNGSASWVLAATFSPDGKRIVTGSDDGLAKVWIARQ